MKQLGELDLPQIDLFDPEYARDPHATYLAAREKSWIARYQFGYLLLDYESMRDFLRDDERCREPNLDLVRMWNAQGTAFERFTAHQLVALRGEEHHRIRKLVAPAFTPMAADRHRQFMRETLEEIIDGVNGQDCEFTELSARYPITVMCRLIGVPIEDVSRFADWLEPQEAAFGQDASMLPEIDNGLVNMYEYITRLVDSRREGGDHPQDLLQDLVEIALEGDRLDDEELRTLLVLLLGAGYDTTKNQLNLVMKMLIDHPEEQEKLAGEPARVKRLINESLRLRNAIGCLHRLNDVDIEYRDVLIPANTFLSMPVTFYGWDAKHADAPGSFDPERRDAPPVIAFGQGIHMCLGQFLARALLEEALPMLARRIRSPRLNGDIVPRAPMGIWGYKSLPIAFDAIAD